jgi:uncharacterized membrane protein
MTARVLSLASCGTALGCALVAGVLFAFSSFVIPALARLPPAQGIAAMQSINVAAINRSFMAAFVGTALACAGLAVVSLVHRHGAGSGLRITGAVLYLAGVVAVTRVCNIPRNDALAALSPDAATAAAEWGRYLTSWTAWNHVRTAAGVLAAAALMWSKNL